MRLPLASRPGIQYETSHEKSECTELVVGSLNAATTFLCENGSRLTPQSGFFDGLGQAMRG